MPGSVGKVSFTRNIGKVRTRKRFPTKEKRLFYGVTNDVPKRRNLGIYHKTVRQSLVEEPARCLLVDADLWGAVSIQPIFATGRNTA